MRVAGSIRPAGPGAGPADGAGDQLGELAGALERRPLAPSDHRPGDPARRPLLAVPIENVGERGLVGLVDQLGGADPLPGHAHVERPVGGEGEAALRILELVRRQAEIEHDAVETRDARIAEQLRHVAEAAGEHGEPGFPGGQPAPPCDRGRVAVEREHATGAGRQDRPGVAAGAEGRVQIDAARAHGERRQHLRQKHRDVAGRRGCGRAGLGEQSQSQPTSSPSCGHVLIPVVIEPVVRDAPTRPVGP